ncbi:MAG: tRNA pseudouridine(38-40) synthase TruA [Wenzhouxiangella sp.]
MRLAVGVEYDGSGFHGWQRQRQSPTVQECLERALGRVADQSVVVHCAGRTDAGVHALCQVAHFETNANRSERSWVLGGNSELSPGISILWVRPVDDNFHARFSASRRRYQYRILNRWVRPALARNQVAWFRTPLDAEVMHHAALGLLGEHDFSSFRAVGCQASSPVRTIHHVAVFRRGNEIFVDIEANGFVYHMVRNIVGVLVAIGQGKQSPSWLAEVLAARDRTIAGITAPAGGLYFVSATYADYPQLPIEQLVEFPAAQEAFK